MADLNSTIVRGKLRVTEEIVGPLNVVNLSTGANGQLLSVSNNVPTWVALNAAAGNNINSVGTPSVAAAIDSNNNVTFTFNYLKGATGPQGPKGDKGDKGDPGSDATVTSEAVKKALSIGTGTSKYLREDGKWETPPNTDTKNTAGSYNNENKLFLIGATSQTSQTGSTKTYSNQKVYTQSKGVYANAFYAASDKRLKENIKDLDLNCLNLVNNINLREFSWKADEEHKPVIGAIAQELRQVLPEKYVHEFIGGQETKDEYLSINDSKLVYLLIGAIQEQQKEIESLKAKIDSKIV